MPEDALSKEPTQHDYTDLMRLESPHEVTPNPDYKPGRPDVPRGVVESQRERLADNAGEAPVDGVGDVEPGGNATDPAPPAAAKADGNAQGDDGEVSDFDPSAHTVAEVEIHLESASPSERARVIEAEKAGKNRAGVLALAD